MFLESSFGDQAGKVLCQFLQDLLAIAFCSDYMLPVFCNWWIILPLKIHRQFSICLLFLDLFLLGTLSFSQTDSQAKFTIRFHL